MINTIKVIRKKSFSVYNMQVVSVRSENMRGGRKSNDQLLNFWEIL